LNPIDTNQLPPGITIRHNFKPGDVGYLTYLHGVLYAQEYGWDHTFEAYVACPLSEFAKSSNERERIWIVETNEVIVGSVAIVEASNTEAQLRWLLLQPDLRGQGIGRYLVNDTIHFCREMGYSSIYLWTVSLLTAATSLYKSLGFQITQEKTHPIWGAVLTEQRYNLELT
jgi:N-acetylglutamate synthase-like GNAT family acetyltransferase